MRVFIVSSLLCIIIRSKNPLGIPNFPVSVCNAKCIWGHIKEEMDVSYGKEGKQRGDTRSGGNENCVPDPHPMEDIKVSALANDASRAEPSEDGEDANAASVGGRECGASAGGSIFGTPWAEAAAADGVIAGAHIHMLRQSRYEAGSSQSSFYDLIQYMPMRAEKEITTEQRLVRNEGCQGSAPT